ncbi:hypothetical protein KPATCC21470_7657 [Kitasatospora purpeofusca]
MTHPRGAERSAPGRSPTTTGHLPADPLPYTPGPGGPGGPGRGEPPSGRIAPQQQNQTHSNAM